MPIRYVDQASALLYHARAVTPFCSENGEPYASIPAGIDSRHVMPLRSAAFRDWLTANFYGEHESAPSPTAYQSVLRLLQSRARYGDAPPQPVNYRLGFEGDPFTPSKIFLDLANSDGEIVEITSQGWQIADNLRHSFRQSPSALPLPRPTPPSANSQPLAAFSDLFRLTGATRTRTLTWIATSLRPIGPYPILVVRGPVASGKSVFARALRALIDPSAAPIRRLPTRDRELLHFASQQWMLAFDHVHRIPPKTAEALSAISSGDTLEITQADYRDPLVYQIARPMILIVPDDETLPAWTPPRALSNRALVVDLEPLTALRPEAAFWSEFEALRPALLASLTDAVATALRRIRDIDLGNVARFPDGAAWTAAAAPALDISERDIKNALSDPDAVWIGSNPLRKALHALIPPGEMWTGDATALLDELRAIAPLAAIPSTPKGVSQALSAISGIHCTKSKLTHGSRSLTIQRKGGASQVHA